MYDNTSLAFLTEYFKQLDNLTKPLEKKQTVPLAILKESSIERLLRRLLAKQTKETPVWKDNTTEYFKKLQPTLEELGITKASDLEFANYTLKRLKNCSKKTLEILTAYAREYHGSVGAYLKQYAECEPEKVLNRCSFYVILNQKKIKLSSLPRNKRSLRKPPLQDKVALEDVKNLKAEEIRLIFSVANTQKLEAKVMAERLGINPITLNKYLQLDGKTYAEFRKGAINSSIKPLINLEESSNDIKCLLQNNAHLQISLPLPNKRPPLLQFSDEVRKQMFFKSAIPIINRPKPQENHTQPVIYSIGKPLSFR